MRRAILNSPGEEVSAGERSLILHDLDRLFKPRPAFAKGSTGNKLDLYHHRFTQFIFNCWNGFFNENSPAWTGTLFDSYGA